MIANLDIYESYADVNEALDLTGDSRLSEDRNTEQWDLIVGTRKWSWEGMSERGPELGLGLTMREHVKINDKYDIFIYSLD